MEQKVKLTDVIKKEPSPHASLRNSTQNAQPSAAEPLPVRANSH